MSTIYFYGPRSPFSNFSNHGFVLDGYYWPTSEHYFQAQKFMPHSLEHFHMVRLAKNAREAANFGRDRRFPLRSNWDRVKDIVMKRALVAKFTQNAHIGEILLSTGSKKLVDDSMTDYYWGIGRNKTGLNRLGELLMQVRDKHLVKHDVKLSIEYCCARKI